MKLSSSALAAASLVIAVNGFQSKPSSGRGGSTLKMVSVDPSVVTKQEYKDICGVSFDEGSLEDRLKRTNYLYPKHVEVIEDIAPIAGAMVDDIVSQCWLLWRTVYIDMEFLTIFCNSFLKQERKPGNLKTSCLISLMRTG